MVFSSMTFLFLFLPLVGLSYVLCKNRSYRNGVLLLCSLLFYSWGEPRYIILMLLASLVAYVGGLLLDKHRANKGLKKAILCVTVALLLSNLLAFKYGNFLVDNFNAISGQTLGFPELALPIGISFYTFQILSYVIDLYRQDIDLQKNYFDLTLYVSFFPQLIAGPIVRYRDVAWEIQHRKESLDDVVLGLRRFIVGLSKKVLIANQVALLANIVYNNSHTEVYGSAWYLLASLSYTFQIYFDFSGYSDMAIGLGRMFGFHFGENFNYPYIFLSITEFWRRWHMSLSSWFRDYVYIPLGGNRVSGGKAVCNILIVWALTGFWHGASWNFILWGLYYGLLLLLEKRFLQQFLQRLPKGFQWLYAFSIVNLGWVLFNLTDFASLRHALQMMFCWQESSLWQALAFETDILKGLFALPLAAVCSLPVWHKCFSRPTILVELGKNTACLFLFGLCVVFILSSSFNPFIYFRF